MNRPDGRSLRAEGVSFAYGRTPVVRALDFELAPGEVLGLVGPNGAGKSTVLRLLTRVLRPSSGRVVLNGRDAARLSRRELARALAVVPQGGALPEDYGVWDLVMMGRAPHMGLLASERAVDVAVVERVMRRTDTWRFRERTAAMLSGGERQRVLLARALAQEPSYLLLDEPTNHLDLHYQIEILRLTREAAVRGVGALVVLHDLNLAARVCDRVLVMHRGRPVALGSPGEVLSEELLREVYGADAEVFVQPGGGAPVVLPKV
ncbi:MAG TPA: ABC transporter ATP-binding protein [Trueperaceae bacterium]